MKREIIYREHGGETTARSRRKVERALVIVLKNRTNTSEGKQLIALLISQLQQLDLARVILFGSYAYGTPTETSDIDLLVVLNSDHYPRTYKEKSDLYLQVSRAIRDIRQQISVDLIVHTKSMHRKFIELDSMFSKEVLQKGKVLYEANHESMARQVAR